MHTLARLRPFRCGAMIATTLAFVAIPLRAQESTAVESTRAPARDRDDKSLVPLASEPRKQADIWKPKAAVFWDRFDSTRAMMEDEAAGTLGVPYRIGVNIPSPIGVVAATKDGTWTVLKDGRRIWTLELRAPEAKGLRVHFARLDLPEDTSISVTDRESGTTFTYRGQGPYDDPGFWTGDLFGDTVYIEYLDESGLDRMPTVEIDEISYFYREPPGRDALLETGGVQRGGLLPCHEDPNCHGADANARDSVGQMTYTVPGQGTFVCSGGLLNDTDPNTLKGYFLTANHCVSTQSVINSLQIRWLYGTSFCGGGLFSGPITTGGTLLATSTTTDFTLLRMASDPENNQGLAAWNSTAVGNNGVTVRGIHHPNGSWKRYSSGTTTSAGQICAGRPISNYLYNDYTIGMIEGGSSGSPIFNSNWEVVGQCNGICTSVGLPDCDTPLTSYNLIYGRFSAEYASISSFLNTITPDDAYEDNDTFPTPAALPAGNHSLILIDFHDYFRVTVCGNGTLSATATFTSSQMDLDMELFNSSEVTLDTSFGFTGTENVSVPVTTGDYIVHMIKDTGWGGAYTLNVTFSPNNDCDDNDLDDVCELAAGGPDCNNNSTLDACDIVTATSTDCDGNTVPDECDLAAGGPDCNNNSILDDCDLQGASTDCDHNGILDECDVAAGGPDCNNNTILDDCDLDGASTDCNANLVPDECDVAAGGPDCNANTILDDCDLQGASTDCDGNDVPDECDVAAGGPDCNANTILDDCDLQGASPDCNANFVPDECDVTAGLDTDCNGNTVLDDCEAYCELYGDIVDVNSMPVSDCQVDVTDLICVLDDFTNPTACAGDGDIIGPGGSCGSDGIYDVDDITAELNSFTGSFLCPHPCPP